MEILVRCSPNLVNHSFIYYVLISSTWQHGFVLQHILTWRKFENNVRTALRNVTNMKCKKSGLLLFCFVFLVIYRGFCEIIFSYACALTQWRISDQRDTVRRRGEEGGISRWMRMGDSDCIFAKWAAVRIESSATAIDSELSSQVQLICRRYW